MLIYVVGNASGIAGTSLDNSNIGRETDGDESTPHLFLADLFPFDDTFIKRTAGQYVYVRTKSVLEKAGYVPNIEEVNFELLQDKASQNVITTLYNFENVLMNVVDKNEPSLLARYLIELAQNYSNFYNENKIIDDNKDVQNARVFLSKCVGQVLKTGAGLLGIQMPNKM